MLARSKTRFHAVRLRLEEHIATSPAKARLWEVGLFVFKQGWACLFGAVLLALVLVTKAIWPVHAWLARYDFLFLAALALQILLLATRMETVREAKVILMFHVIGTVMEVFKTSMGSWTYPGDSFFRIGHVPLFSGFMYASVGSFIARATRILNLRYSNYPKRWFTAALALAIYVNFFTHHFIPDVRLALFVLVAIAFGDTWVYYKPYRKFRRMPLIVGFFLIAFFLWLAENIGTFAAIWIYPQQHHGWQLVSMGKFGSWFLLMIVSFILVSFAHPPQAPDAKH